MTMTGIEIEARLKAGWPGVGWSLDGECVKGLIWPENAGPKPTLKQIKAVVLPPPSYPELRAAAYRELGGIGDVLDTVIAELKSRGEPATEGFSALAAKLDAIKPPKP